MKKIIAGALLLASTLSHSACVNGDQILYFTNSLVTRKCYWVDQVDLWRTTHAQYSTIFFGDSLIVHGSWPGKNMGLAGDTTQLLLQRIVWFIINNTRSKKETITILLIFIRELQNDYRTIA